MKTKYIQSILILVITFFSVTANAQISKAEIRATGLTCSMCSNAINKQLKTLENVQEVEVDLNTNTFIVTLNNQNTITPLQFKQKVEDAGFFIGSLVLTMPSNEAKKAPYIFVGDMIKNSDSIKVQVLDEGYVTAKAFKKLSKSYKDLPTFGSLTSDNFHIKMTD